MYTTEEINESYKSVTLNIIVRWKTHKHASSWTHTDDIINMHRLVQFLYTPVVYELKIGFPVKIGP